MMNAELVNHLVEGERLKQQFSSVDNAADLMQQVLAWKASVEAFVQGIPRPLNEEHKKSVGALVALTEGLSAELIAFRAQIQRQHEQLLKVNQAVSAYGQIGS